MIFAKLVVSFAKVGIGKYLVSFANVLELFMGTGVVGVLV
jgi:hypothetical protein